MIVRQSLLPVLILGLLLVTLPAHAAKPVYRIGLYPNPPLAFLDEMGQPSGLFPELLARASRGQNWTLSYLPCRWSQCLQQLKAGEIDLLAPIAYTPERAERYDFLATTILSNWGQIYAPAGMVSSILDLDGKRVAAVEADVFLEGSSGLRQLARNFAMKIEFIQVQNYAEALQMVKQGRADVALLNRIYGAWHREEFQLEPSSVLINPVDIRVAFAPGRALALQSELNALFDQWKKTEGSPYHRLVGTWLSPVSSKARVPTWVVPLIGSAVVLLFIMWLLILQTRWQVRLKIREIKTKNAELKNELNARREVEESLLEQYEFLQTIIDGVTDPITVISPNFELMMMNRVATELIPEHKRERSDFCCYELLHQKTKPCRGEDHPCPLQEVKNTGKTVTMIHRHLVGNEMRIFELTASPIWNVDGSLRGIIEASRDITDRLKVEELLGENEKRLQHMAHHDPLTGLPNRLLFEDRLRHALAQAQRNRHKMALMFIDLDRFKKINDTLGHEVGDQLLKDVGRRLHGAVREGDTVARFGGDEFLVLLEQVDNFQTVTTMAQRIRHELGRISNIGNYQLVATGSIGISIFPDDALVGEELIKCADVAMYHAKSEGKDNYQFYTSHMNARAHEMLLLERDLRRALEEGQLCLYYQPQVELETGNLMGVEALLRWNHPKQGLVPPNDFIPLAEETGLIVPIGEWVLREACRQQVAWQKDGFPALRMAVNISGRQLRERDFIETVDLILTETGITPADLELEITESIIMRDVKSTIMDLTDLRMRGIRLSIDDFGTGYSSLSYLNRFPVDQLKIDHSFVFRLVDESEPVMIVDAIIALGRSMNLEVIAEGIESQGQIEILAKRGCQLGQGYLFSRPIPEAELRDKFLKIARTESHGDAPCFRFNFPELDA
ncbi:MAG: EAL domain-containing protein [Geopsychrobacter sp.]|nr:EAL domain-containing protein [Geopsychrobacter sp.]